MHMLARGVAPRRHRFGVPRKTVWGACERCGGRCVPVDRFCTSCRTAFDVTVERRQIDGVDTRTASASAAWWGRVVLSNGWSLEVSRLDGDPDWIVDGIFVDGAPRSYSGFGNRCTTRRRVVAGTLAVALDAATGRPDGKAATTMIPYAAAL